VTSAKLLAGAKNAREAALLETRRQLIVDAAWRVFADVGFDGATMRGIAAAAGCTTGAIYPLFKSKEQIYAVLLEQSLRRLHAAVSEAIDGERNAALALRAGADAFVGYYLLRPDEVTLGLYLWNGLRPRGLEPAIDRKLNQNLFATTDRLQAATTACTGAEGDLARRETAALFAFLVGSLVVHQAGRLRSLKQDIRAIVSLHLDQLVAVKARPARRKADDTQGTTSPQRSKR
jgi:TetR/AcrR family transcriptional regulator